MDNMNKTALITGITGQDGRYLAQHLLSKGYNVYGMVSGQNNVKLKWVKKNLPDVNIVEGDLRDMSSLIGVLEISNPDEIYNLAAISHVGFSWKQPELVGEVTGLGVLRMLEAIKIYTKDNMSKIRFYQASSSEMFGKVRETPQNELTSFHPRSPYGVSKAYGHNITVNYRESYGAFACSGILFNHESPLRGEEFVTKKITKAVARIKLGKQKELRLGNIDSKRDWGFAGDYVKAMHLMLQQDIADDYVIATGETHSIREFLDLAFARVGIDDWKPYVIYDENFVRPAEVDSLLGDASKAKEKMGWVPDHSFEDLVNMMVDYDLEHEA
jgi:GDPmannose 4,6-dehydratase